MWQRQTYNQRSLLKQDAYIRSTALLDVKYLLFHLVESDSNPLHSRCAELFYYAIPWVVLHPQAWALCLPTFLLANETQGAIKHSVMFNYGLTATRGNIAHQTTQSVIY